MKILFFSESLGVHEARFLRKLASRCHQVWFLPLFPVISGEEQSPSINFLPPLMQVRDDAMDAMLVAAGRLTNVVSQVKPDVIHAGPLTSCGFVASLAHEAHVLAMSWGWDLLSPELDPEQLGRARQALRSASWACCDCETLREAIVRQEPGLAGRVSVFPWGVDLDRFHPGAEPRAIPQKCKWQDCRVVLHTRSLEELYGVRTIVPAALEAQAASPRLRFIFAGDGTLRNWAEERVRAAGAEYAFSFLGRVPERSMPGIFTDAGVYLSGSQTDGTSISLLQAMASGLPAIVSDLPANREWIKAEVNGWLVPCGDVTALAAVLRAVACMDHSALEEIGSKNRMLAQQRADWDLNFNVLLQSYEMVASDGFVPARAPIAR